MSKIEELTNIEIDEVSAGAEGDSYWGGVGKIALGVGIIAAGVITGGAAVVAAGVIAGAGTAAFGVKEASGALDNAGEK